MHRRGSALGRCADSKESAASNSRLLAPLAISFDRRFGRYFRAVTRYEFSEKSQAPCNIRRVSFPQEDLGNSSSAVSKNPWSFRAIWTKDSRSPDRWTSRASRCQTSNLASALVDKQQILNNAKILSSKPYMNRSSGSSDEQDHISQIMTRWTLVFRAREQSSGNDGSAARSQLVSRYAVAITRFLYGILKKAGRIQHAEDITQNVFVMILEGGLNGADPAKGRFRDYLKGALRYSLNRQLQRIDREVKRESPADAIELAQLIEESFESNEFESQIRFGILNQAFVRLEQFDESSGQYFAALLKWRRDNLAESSVVMAAYLTGIRKQPTTPENARKMRQRAAKKYSECLADVIMESLPMEQRSRADFEEQLRKLDLMTLLPQNRAL